MAIYKYESGDLKSGFIGYRAVRNTAPGVSYRQRYWSFNHYARSEAYHLAKAQEAEWAEEALVRERTPHSVNWRVPIRSSVSQMPLARGLRFGVGKNIKRGKTYWGLFFTVYDVNTKRNIVKSIASGADGAWQAVIAIYNKVYGIPLDTLSELQPTKKAILEYLDSVVPVQYPECPVIELNTLLNTSLKGQ